MQASSGAVCCQRRAAQARSSLQLLALVRVTDPRPGVTDLGQRSQGSQPHGR